MRLISVRRLLSGRSPPRFSFGGQSILLGGSYPARSKELLSALSAAQANVIGPLESTADALRALQSNAPQLAVVDLHWREGFGFEIPRALQARGIRFVVLTGFTANLLPSDITPSAFIRHPVAAGPVIDTLKELAEDSKAAA